MRIDLQLVQDTMDYLTTCPWKDVDGLVNEWRKTVNQPKSDVKPEEKPDAG